ncbi:hypothetical protein FDENT_12081 [Fusarium denticulatum]|uniref:Uncharacterized protein n=1 Tax=Fusarium denticulatum TaxID=48507 RepID=A0A8H5WRK5_9HYPO|nr:hypothetical protein FDENT_12081 [Fusarium denticulatum]
MLPSSENNWFTWSTVPKPLVDGKDEGDPDADLRILRLPSFVQKQMDRLNDNMGSFTDDEGKKQNYFRDDVPNSALLAMQLNDPYYQLFVALDKDKGSGDEAAPSPLSTLRSAATGPVQELRSLRFMTPTPFLASHNQMMMILIHQSAAGPSASSQTSNLAGPPIYKCNAYSLQQDVIIQDKDCLPQDIVFSVLVSRNKFSSYQLSEFDIAIELGTSADDNCIMETYAGPGARMLSNLRFNVLMSFTTMPVTERKCLLLRLIPRSHKGWIRMKDVHEMSFMLTLAQLNSFVGNERFSFYTSAYYKFDHEHDPITDYFEVTLEKHH